MGKKWHENGQTKPFDKPVMATRTQTFGFCNVFHQEVRPVARHNKASTVPLRPALSRWLACVAVYMVARMRHILSIVRLFL
ncbi:hypothetical protein SY86_14500 [Erwinia tracheiphila]|uniref:Uncharacterized protein n=2 Tax=Erwinia tracheiphila TaxID=65700 RepID=A0A0M2KAG0_9GAMM|nr:hypothetical protein AV903_00255 [Erwinia tracheiphila]EOS95271.1 hypothetical protein ETR_09306 [Erwinia tracheiphila PSU-1]KKF36380.1 hypothetical protein SY86_14500 [Erwinia tracheiphila]